MCTCFYVQVVCYIFGYVGYMECPMEHMEYAVCSLIPEEMLDELMKIFLLKATKMVVKVYPQEQLPIVFLFSESTFFSFNLYIGHVLILNFSVLL